MSISTHAELKTALTNWLKRADLSSYLDDLVMLGEKWIMRNVRGVDMETTFSSTISSGVITAPTGFLGLKHAYVDGSPIQPLKIRTPQQIYLKYPQRSSDSKPEWIGYDAGSMIFGPYPDSNYTIKGTYFKRQGPLSSATYDLFTNNPDLFLMAALVETEAFIKNDKRIDTWRQKRDGIALDINNEAKGISVGGGIEVITA